MRGVFNLLLPRTRGRGGAALALLLTLFTTPALALIEPHSGGGDPHIRIAPYDPDEVVAVRAVLGYQLTIEFEPGERIENVAIGDSLGWQVVPSRKADLLFVKPMDRAPLTNMTVVTSLRRYAFELSVRPAARGARDAVYTLRFAYPAPAAPVITAPEPPKPPEDRNHAYSYEGSAVLLPTRLFDDGQATWFQFAKGAEYPAVYAIESDGTQALVNFHSRDSYLVVDRMARGFVLRRGKEETRIFNDGFETPGPGPLSPRPRVKKTAWRRR